MSLLLTDMPKIWDDNLSFKNMFHFAQVFWRFSADEVSQTGLTVSFVFILLLFIILEGTVFVIFLVYIKTSIINQISHFTVCLFQEIILQVLSTWVSSQLATVLSLIIIDSSFRNAFHYVQLVIYILFFVYYFIYSFLFANNDVDYMKGRSFMWSFKEQRYYICSTIINLFLTRLIEMLSKIPSLICSVLIAIYVIIFIVFIAKYLPIIDLDFNSYYISCSISFIFGFILQLISFHIHDIDAAIVVVVVIILTLALLVVFNIINRKRQKQSIELLNSLMCNEVQFSDAFKNKNSFLLTVRFGFVKGHQYFFSWQPFMNAIEAWPNDRDIWIQFIRFLVIYPDQGQRFEQTMNEFLKKGFKDLSTKYIISQVKFIKNSRNKHLNHDLKQELQIIDEEIKNNRVVIITYWNELSGGSVNSNSTFNIASKLKKSLDQVNKKYHRLLSLYPNNYPISSKYSEFMFNILVDPVEGTFWENRTQNLKNRKEVLTDATQEYAFSLFPFIPHSLQPNSTEENISNLQKKRNNHSKLNSSILNLENEDFDVNLKRNVTRNDPNTDSKENSSSSNINATSLSANDDKNMEPSRLRNSGLNARVPFITNILMVLAVFSIIALLLIPFIPPIMMKIKMNKYIDQFDTLKSLCDLRTSLMKEPYYIFFQGMRSLTCMMDGAFEPYSNEMLNDEIKKLNKNMEFFNKKYGTTIKIDSEAGKYINRTKIEFYIKGENKNISFIEGLSTMSSSVFNHDDPFGSYYDQIWFQFIFDNIDNMESSIGTLSKLACLDINEYQKNSISLISVILYILIAIEVVLIPIFIYFTLLIRKRWDYIINTINSLPRVAIQKVIEKYSNENIKHKKNENDHKNFRSEFRYKLSLVQMVSSRETSGGLPIKSIILIFIIDFIISVGCVVAVVQIMDIMKNDLTIIPIQYYTATDGIFAIYKFISVFLIKGYIDMKNIIPAMTGQPPTATFGKYNHEYIREGVEYVSNQMLNILNQVIFGSDDDPKKGILFSTKEIVDLLIQSNGNPYGETDRISKLDMEKFPHFVGIDMFYELNLKFIDQIMAKPNFNSIYSQLNKQFDLSCLFISVKLGTFSIVPKFFDVYIDKTNKLFHDEIDEFLLILFVLGAGIFVVGTFAISWLLIKIFNVKKVVQFSLSLLSMIDPVYVEGMQNIMNLFYGRTDDTVQINQIIQRTYNEIESHVPESVIELDSSMKILFICDRLVDIWELKKEQTVGSHINLNITFNDNTVYEQLVKQANGQANPKKPRNYNTLITIGTTKKVINTTFTSYYVPKCKTTKLILMFQMNGKNKQKEFNIDEIQQKNKDIKILSVPDAFKNKINVDTGKNSFTSHYLIFGAIEILNINEYIKNHSPKETKNFFKSFENKINEICENPNLDASYIKKIGNVFIIGFNFIQQNTNYYKSAQNSIEFMKDIHSFANSNNYKIRSSIISTKSATSLLLSKNTLKFDIYSNEIQQLILILKCSNQNYTMFPAKIKDLLPENITSQAEETEIILHNKDPEWGYKIKFN